MKPETPSEEQDQHHHTGEWERVADPRRHDQPDDLVINPTRVRGRIPIGIPTLLILALCIVR